MAIKKKCLPKKYDKDTKEESCKIIEADLLWNQSKINKVWVEAKEMSQKFGTIIDPRLLIAIILQEGTGSFDTNFNPSDAFNAGYIQPEFDIDLKDAFNSHIMGKIWVYSNCGNEFKNSCKIFLEKTSKNGTKYSGKGTLFEYVNSNVYRLRMRNGQLGLKLGAYATDFQWHLNLSNFFNTMCFEYKDNNSKWNATARYSDYIIKHPIKWPQEIKKPNFKFKLTSDGTNSATVDGFPMIAAD